METLTLSRPALYGDHHVIEVRRILLAMPGVQDIYASSAFQLVEITYDPQQIDPDTITARLGEAGYLESLELPSETGNNPGQSTYFRHTTAYAEVGRVVSFAQGVETTGRALWPCPGLGVITDEGK